MPEPTIVAFDEDLQETIGVAQDAGCRGHCQPPQWGQYRQVPGRFRRSLIPIIHMQITPHGKDLEATRSVDSAIRVGDKIAADLGPGDHISIIACPLYGSASGPQRTP